MRINMNDPIPPEFRQRIEARVAIAAQRQDSLEQKFAASYLSVAEEITVSLADFRAPFVGLEPGDHRVWLVIRTGAQSVFYDPKNRNFGACWGPEIGSGEWLDLGFRSDDPFQMYVI
jgi:hypothetical protein